MEYQQAFLEPREKQKKKMHSLRVGEEDMSSSPPSPPPMSDVKSSVDDCFCHSNGLNKSFRRSFNRCLLKPPPPPPPCLLRSLSPFLLFSHGIAHSFLPIPPPLLPLPSCPPASQSEEEEEGKKKLASAGTYPRIVLPTSRTFTVARARTYEYVRRPFSHKLTLFPF